MKATRMVPEREGCEGMESVLPGQFSCELLNQKEKGSRVVIDGVGRTWLTPAEHELAKMLVASEAAGHHAPTPVSDKKHGTCAHAIQLCAAHTA